MTPEERLSMKKFEAKVRQVIAQFGVLKQENADLYAELESRDEEIKRLKGRLPCVHFKDMFVEPDGEQHFTWCGNGILDFAAIGQALKDAGTEYIFIEQDKTFACEPDPFKCLEKSKKHLESLGFEF